MFSNSHNLTIEGGNFTAVEGNYHHHSHIHSADRQQIALDKLLRHIATGAFHNSEERYDAPKCHPHTRESVTTEIMQWAADPTTQRLFLWLYGPAGAGKSAIAQTIAERCKEAGILAASFFFSRTAPMRNEKTYLITTIAYQLMNSIPEIAGHVLAAIIADPTIFSLSLATQIDQLIVRPLEAASLQVQVTENRRPMVVLLDGLDECDGLNARFSILDGLLTSIRRFRIPLYFLIASRPEQDIRDCFHSEGTTTRVLGLALDTNYQPDADIRLFLHDKFDEIRRRHPMKAYIPSDWPNADDISSLVTKASGQFIYASTVVKSVESPRHRPFERLSVVLGITPGGNHTPFSELDALYSRILASVFQEHLTQALEIFAYVILHSAMGFKPDVSYLSPQRIDYILGYAPGSLQIYLTDLHALVHVPDEKSYSLVKLHHASLSDYFFDESRSGKYFIDYKKAHARIATKIIHCLQRVPKSAIDRFYLPHLVDSVLLHSKNCELSLDLKNALYDLNLVDTVVSFDDQTAVATVDPRTYSDLPRDLDEFFRWLDSKHDVDPSKVLLKNHAQMFFGWLSRIFDSLSAASQDNLSAVFALMGVFREARLLDIIMLVHGDEISSPEDRLYTWISSESYVNTLMSQFVTSPTYTTRYLVDDGKYAKLGCTLCQFLLQSRNKEWDLLCDSALESLLCVIPKAAKSDDLESKIRALLYSFQLSNEDRFAMVGLREGHWKSRITRMAVKCLGYMKQHQISYAEHTHERAYYFCVWCEAKKEVNKPASTSGVPSGLRLKKKI